MILEVVLMTHPDCRLVQRHKSFPFVGGRRERNTRYAALSLCWTDTLSALAVTRHTSGAERERKQGEKGSDDATELIPVRRTLSPPAHRDRLFLSLKMC